MATFSDAYILCFGQLKNSGGFNAKDFPEVSNVKAPEEAWYPLESFLYYLRLKT